MDNFFVDFIRVIEKVVKVQSSLDNMCKYLKMDWNKDFFINCDLSALLKIAVVQHGMTELLKNDLVVIKFIIFPVWFAYK